MRRHKKKVGLGISVLSALLIALGFWSDIYPVICPFLSNPDRCIKVSKALEEVESKLSTLDGGIVLE